MFCERGAVKMYSMSRRYLTEKKNSFAPSDGSGSQLKRAATLKLGSGDLKIADLHQYPMRQVKEKGTQLVATSAESRRDGEHQQFEG
jgi:hypothetical protein